MEQTKCPILVIKERQSKAVWTVPVVQKGSSSSLVVERVLKIVAAIGSSTIVIKSDQEHAIKDVQNEVKKRLWKDKNALIERIGTLLKETTKKYQKT